MPAVCIPAFRALGHIDDMPTPKPKLLWYQFSLRSLLLLTLFVAVLCSLGVCTHWLISVAIGMTVVIGGIAGSIVAGTKLGFVQGVVFGIQFLLIAVVVCAFLSVWDLSWRLFTAIGIAVLIGGILGGFTVRPRSR